MTDGDTRQTAFTADRDTTAARDTQLHPGPKLRLVKPDERRTDELSIEELYPQREASTPELRTAMDLLTEGLAHLHRAVEATDDGDVLGADDSIAHLQVMMPELFCCRALGDSYGAIINAVMGSLRNRQGEPLSTIQIRTLSLVLKDLRTQPFMRFDRSLDLIDSLENVGLNTEPEAFSSLVEWI